MRLFDGSLFSSFGASVANVTIVNTAPNAPNLSSPADANTTTDRAPNFTWVSNGDADGESLTYELNVSLIAASTCSEASRHIASITSLSYLLTSDLKCLYDHLDYYNWTVRAYDGTSYSSWANFFRVNISSAITISLPDSSVLFNNINFQGTNDTTTNSPSPLLIRNDGNAFVNVTIQATNLWNTQVNPSKYYQFKIDNYTLENNSFNWLKSITIFTNIFASGFPSLAIAELNYTNATDSAEIDINISVPPDEGSGVRSSTVTLTSSLAE